MRPSTFPALRLRSFKGNASDNVEEMGSDERKM